MFGIFKRIRELEKRVKDTESAISSLRLDAIKARVKVGSLVWIQGVWMNTYYLVREVLSKGVVGESVYPPKHHTFIPWDEIAGDDPPKPLKEDAR